MVAAVIACLLVIWLQIALLAGRNSATWDEPDHTYAAYMQWKHGDFGLNAEHPPLLKFLAALPLLTMHLAEPPLLDQPYRLQEVRGGRAFVFGNDANAILFRARMAASLLTLLLAVLVFLAAREFFGEGAGWFALGLLCFDPTLLAHSGLVTTDAGQACFLFWAVYAFYRYVNVPNLPRLIVLGLVVGLALATKHSAVLIFPILVLLGALEVLRRHRVAHSERSHGTPSPTGRFALRLAAALFATGLIAVVVLWSWYGFRYAARAGGTPLNPSVAVQLDRVPSAFEAGVLRTVDRFHLLPQSYTYGFAHVLIQSKAFNSYLFGGIYPHPVWFYFPVAMLVKSTLTFLLMTSLTAWAALTRRIQFRRELLYLLLPSAVYMVFAMAGGMNIGIRHILPIYIFLTCANAGVAWMLSRGDRRWLYGFTGLLLFQAVSVLHAFPAYVSYANEAFGGPGDVHKYLSDSSSDWAQQLKDVKTYLDRRGVKNCWFAYFGEGVAEYSYYGIPCKPLITADSLYFDVPHPVPPAIDGPVLMSAGVLSGFEFGPAPLNPYEQFKTLKPEAVIDHGVFVYEGHFDLPLASALSHTQVAGVLLAEKNPAAALSEAEGAQELAPASATVTATLCQALAATAQREKAIACDRQALALAATIAPKFQASLAKQLQARLAQP